MLPSFLIILSILLLIYAVVLFVAAKTTYNKFKKLRKGTHVCIYNDMSGCYETPCKDCLAKNECQWVCEGDCDICEGYKIKEEGIK